MSKFYINKSEFCIHYCDWIIIWFILYKFKIVNYNPKFSIIVAIIQNLLIEIGILITQKKLSNRIRISRTIHMIIKFIMFYFLLHTPFTKSDFIANIILYILYCIWLYLIHNKKFIDLDSLQIKKNLESINKKYKIRLDKAHKDYNNNIDKINYNYNIILNNYNKNKKKKK